MGIKSLAKNKKGFTIIEVVLVLAIAGLIFLMVFIAYPALRRNQMDTQRKDDLARFSTALNSYQSNNNGKVPREGEWHTFIENYLISNGDKFGDPDGWTTEWNNNVGYDVTAMQYNGGTEGITLNGDFSTNNHMIHVYTGATCDGEKVVGASGARKVAFQYKLEGGGVYCGNN